MLQRTTFKRQPMPERQPLPWPGPQSFAPATRCDGMEAAQPKPVEHRNPALLAMARGKPCLLCIPGVCNHDPRTTVAAHSNWSEHGKAKARKADDHYSVWGCSACHAWLDQGPAPRDAKAMAFTLAHLDQVLAWRRIVGDMSHRPKDRAAVHWALCLLNTSEIGAG